MRRVSSAGESSADTVKIGVDGFDEDERVVRQEPVTLRFTDASFLIPEVATPLLAQESLFVALPSPSLTSH